MYTMLVVDDNRFIVDGLVKLLETARLPELQLCSAYSPEQAMALIRKRTPDIALVDIMMGEIDGFQLTQRIHALNARCKVIFLTAYDRFEYIHRAMRNDSFGYILKTEGEDEILSTIVRAVHALDEERAAKDANHPEQPAPGDLVAHVNQYIESNLSQGVRLAQIARHIGYHPSYLSRLYKQLAGEGVLSYINRLRVERAQQMLVGSRAKIQDIAVQLGFESTSNFIRFFRQNTRMTPVEYRVKNGCRD